MRVLHISDPQFGKFHRFPKPGAAGDLAQRLLEGLDGCTIDLVALTGDVAEWSKPAEYAEAHTFLDRLTTGLSLERRRILIVPGNHDVSRSAYNRYVEECDEYDRKPAAPFWPKWQHYKVFLDDWYGPDAAHFLPSEPWSWWEVPELDLAVAGLNSTLPETAEIHDWALGESQVRWFAERLHSTRARYRLALVHHDLFHGADTATRERERLRDLPLTLLLHGHTHIQTTEKLGDAPALGVGSLGIEKEWRVEDVANQYQVLTLDDRSCLRSLRRFHGPTSSFLPDDDVLSARDRRFKLDMGGERERDTMSAVRFVDRVAEVLALREDGAEVVVLDHESVQVRRGFHRRLVGAAECVDAEVVGRYLRRLADFRAEDPTLPAEIVHRESTRTLGEVTLRSLVELQGLVDFRALRNWQRDRIAEDARYPEARYVPQRIRRGTPHASATDEPRNALRVLYDLVTAPGEDPSLALVLAPFGTGKTFLLRQLARQLEREWTEGARVPLWIELRHLEKAASFDALLAAHLSRAGQRKIDHHQLDYVRREGRVVLLFDGFDELVLRVTYDRATEHLETLAAAAEGRARIVVTSRTEHFLRTQDAEGALLRKIRDVAGLSVLHIQEFSTAEAEAYLSLRMGTAGAKRFKRLQDIPNLLDLARTPRMLEMLADLDDADLDAAEDRAGPMNAARLYNTVIERWLKQEEARRTVPGAPPPLGWTRARQAATPLAERAWVCATEQIDVQDLRAVASGLAAPGFSVEEATQELGSGTLLVRDEAERFRFAHRSVLEFLVAERCAGALNAGEPAQLLDCGEVSGVLVRFLGELAGEALDEWARANVRPGGPEGRRRNALAVAAARKLHVPLDLRGQDLRGRDDLRELDLRGADLSNADLRGLDLSGVDLSGARLEGARLDDARLAGAILEGYTGTPSVTRASFLLARGWGEGPSLKPYVDCGGLITKLAWLQDGGLAAIVGGVIRLYGPDLRQRIILDHPGVAEAMVATADGTLLAGGGSDGLVRVWTVATGERLHTRKGHPVQVTGATFLGASATVVSLDRAGNLARWQEGVSDPLWLLGGEQGLFAVTSSPDGSELALQSHDGIILLRPDGSGRRARLEAAGRTFSVGYNGSGSALLGLSENAVVRRWRRDTGHWDSTPRPNTPDSLALAFDSTRSLCAAATFSNEVVVFDPDGEDEPRVVGAQRDAIESLAFSVDGQHLASGGDLRGVHVWHVATGALVRRLPGHRGAVRSLATTSDGNAVLAASEGRGLMEWDLGSGRLVRSAGAQEGTIDVIAVSGDDTLVAVGTDAGSVVVYDRQFGGEHRPPTEESAPIVGLHFTRDGDLVIARADGGVAGWGIEAGTWSQSNAVHGGDEEDGEDHEDREVVATAILGDQTSLAVVGDTSVRLRFGPKEIDGRAYRSDPGGLCCTAISPADKTIAVGGDWGNLRTWPIDRPDTPTVLRGHLGPVRALTWSPDGSSLASAGDDGAIVITDPSTSAIVRTLTAHHGAIRSLAFSPDGLDLYSAGDDGRILRWDVASGRLMGWMAAGPRGSVCVSSEGRYRTDGDVKGWFWFGHGMHRYDPDEIDRLLPLQRVPDDEPFPWVRPG